MSRWVMVVLLSILMACAPVLAQESSPSPSPEPANAPSPAAEAPPRAMGMPAWSQGWSADGDIRFLGDNWSFFKPDLGFQNDYSFLGIRARGRLKYNAAGFAFLAELQDTQMLGLPRNAIAPPPQSQLGLGGTYFNHALRSEINTMGLRQAWLQFGSPGDRYVRLGRQEYSSAMEFTPKDPILEWMLRVRLNERLIGPFGFTNFARSFDGGRVEFDSPGTRVTAFAANPTQGGFEPHFATHMDDVFVSNLAWTLKPHGGFDRSTAQVFWMHYDDTRNVPFVDNRPLPLRGRVGAQGGIRIDTYGGHFVTRLGERGDALVWAAHQTGKWGTQTHDANAFTVELGYRPKGLPWAPWVRAGYSYASGDGSPLDRRHGTFYAPLPAGRTFARFPVYALANVHDLYGQLILAPGKDTTARVDLHLLDLDTPQDLWYVGAGATQNQGGIFGYAGRPSQGASGLGTLLDFTLRHKINDTNEVELYVGHVFGGGVVNRTFPLGDGATWMYVDYTLKLR